MTGTYPQNRHLGSARVRTYGQTLDAQLKQLRGAGCTKIYREKVTGAQSDRRELLKMLKGLAPGDVVTVTRIDRLARSTFELFAIVKQIVDAKAQFRWPNRGPTQDRELAGRDRDIPGKSEHIELSVACNVHSAVGNHRNYVGFARGCPGAR
jgi:hypothetical protein